MLRTFTFAAAHEGWMLLDTVDCKSFIEAETLALAAAITFFDLPTDNPDDAQAMLDAFDLKEF